MARSTLEAAVNAFRSDVDDAAFVIGTGLVLVSILVLIAVPARVKDALVATNEVLWTNVDWAYQGAMLLLVVLVAIVAVSPWGSRTLGDGDPAYGTGAYIAMLFSAGIAAGIVFWGPAEALFHFESPPPFVGGDGGTDRAATGAIQYTLFHWGITAWSTYVALAIPIGYIAYNYGAPLRVSTILAPYIGVENLDGPLPTGLDILAIFATVGGLATTIGLVSQQFLSGVDYQFDVFVGSAGTVLLVATLTIVFTISAITGINRGIRRISLLNVILFACFGLVILTFGPTDSIVSLGATGTTGYARHFIEMSTYTGGTAWASAWTIFYWAWWLSWAPFVGLFVARISRGRTIRQVVAAGVLVPSIASILWFVIVGATAIEFQRTGATDIMGVIEALGFDESVSIYPLLEPLPVSTVLTVGFLALITTFLVTSADSSAYSLALLSSNGTRHTPSVMSRAYWGGLQGIGAVVLLVVGGTGALQQAAILVGTPFAVITVLAIGGLLGHFVATERGYTQSAMGEANGSVDESSDETMTTRRKTMAGADVQHRDSAVDPDTGSHVDSHIDADPDSSPNSKRNPDGEPSAHDREPTATDAE